MLPRHVYVHVPFCARRCSYCDFAIAVRRDVPVAEYLDALERELRLRHPAGEPWEVDTLYFGGGTPSRLGARGVAGLVSLLRRHVTLASDAEVTLEANPEDVDAPAVAAWREAGVNRVSLGVQSFDPAVLEWMHRVHDAARAAEAVAVARGEGIANLSVDLIFALPERLGRSWERDLDRALALAPSHVSLYGLTIEHATPLGRWTERGQEREAPEERYEREFLLAHDRLGGAGFEHYEVSNFALPGARSRHNSSYWSGAPYAGLGPSAHAFDGSRRRWNVAPYVEWVRRLVRGGDPAAGEEALSEANRADERVYLGLRTTAGLTVAEAEREHVRPWVSAGWATLTGSVLRLTPLGWLRLDSLAADLTLFRSRL